MRVTPGLLLIRLAGYHLLLSQHHFPLLAQLVALLLAASEWLHVDESVSLDSIQSREAVKPTAAGICSFIVH